MSKDFTATIDGRFACTADTEMHAVDALRPIIRPGELAKIYYEKPHPHLIAELCYEDIKAATT